MTAFISERSRSSKQLKKYDCMTHFIFHFQGGSYFFNYFEFLILSEIKAVISESLQYFANSSFTLRRLYFATAEVRFMFSSSFRKLGLAFNLEYLCQFFINFNNQCQFWNPHDEQITNLSLIFKFNEEITEKIGNEKDETKLIFEKYQVSLTSNISAKISSN